MEDCINFLEAKSILILFSISDGSDGRRHTVRAIYFLFQRLPVRKTRAKIRQKKTLINKVEYTIGWERTFLFLRGSMRLQQRILVTSSADCAESLQHAEDHQTRIRIELTTQKEFFKWFVIQDRERDCYPGNGTPRELLRQNRRSLYRRETREEIH